MNGLGLKRKKQRVNSSSATYFFETNQPTTP